MPYCVNAAVEHPKVADADASVDSAAAESKPCQLSASHDAVLPFRQRPNLSFALKAFGAPNAERVRLTMHGNVKCTRKRIRPRYGPVLGLRVRWLGRVAAVSARGCGRLSGQPLDEGRC